MKSMLEREDVWDAVDKPKPEELDDGYAQWVKDDRKARSTIALFVEDSQLRFVKKAETAREMWRNLQTYHEKATIGNQAMLLQQLCSLNLGEGGDVERHIDQIESLYERLDNAGIELGELLRIIMLLRSLPPSFSSFVTSLENRPQEDLTMDLVVARLRDECQKRECQQKSVAKQEKALRTEVKAKSEQRKCFFCHQPGHFRRNCRKFLESKNGESSKESKKPGPEQQAKQAEVEKSTQQPVAKAVCGAVCFVAGDGIPGAWVVDSGCTCHMTNDRGFFTEFNKDVVIEVTLADGTKTKSAGCGSGVLFGVNGDGIRIAITLDYVLFVPALEGGLISVRKLALKGFDVVFKVNHCEIKSADGVVVAVGEAQANQYVLKIAEACMVATGNHTDECQHTWHRRIGHRDMDVVGIIQSKELANGMKMKDCGERIVCECCLKGKLARNPFPQATDRKSKQPLDLIHTDLCGPMENPTPSGNKYFMTMIDDYSRFCVVFLLKSKGEAANKIEEYVRWTENLFGRKPRVVRSDGGGEYIAESLQDFYRAEGIRAQFSTPYSPQSNGVAERKNRSLQEMANCMLLDADLPKRYWGEAILTAAFIQNRLPSRAVDRTPFELWTGVKPDLSRLRVFGCEAYVHVPDVKRKKFDPKAKKLVFVGYSDNHKGYRFVDCETDRITVSRDARFIELGNGSQQQEERVKEPEASVNPESAVCLDGQVEPEADCDSECEVLFERNGRDQVAEEPEEPEESVYEDANDSEDDFLGFDEAEMRPMRREDRYNRGVLPIRFQDYVVGQVSHEEEPGDYREAMRVPEWRRAMCEEMEAHKVNQTWDLVKLPVGKKLVGAKWVFKLKRNELGEVMKHKARIVAQGYTQTFGVDYSEVYAPVTRQTTLRAMLAVAGKKGLLLKQYDVKTAYLNGTIDEELYMRQPPGFEVTGRDMVCKLRKSIYGLKQSARCWNKALRAVLLDLGFVQCDSDSCLYVRRSEQATVYLLVYVDDLLMGCTEEAEMDRIFEGLRERFEITSLGPVRHFLGHEIGREEEGYYSLRLTAYIDHLVKKFGMENAHPVRTPMDPGYTTLNEGSKPFPDKMLYRSLVGALLYLSVNARPDLSISVGLLGRKVSDPNHSDWNATKRALQYLKATKDYKLKFVPGDGWNLTGYSDSDWAGDKRTRRSTSGYVFFYGGGPICWVSKGQDCVALSSLEAEYNALTLTCQEAVWLRRLLSDLDEPQSGVTTVYEDNQGCLSFAKAERASGRVKHIDTKGHYIRELCERKIIQLIYCPTAEMIADALTKPLGPSLLLKFVHRVGLSAE